MSISYGIRDYIKIPLLKLICWFGILQQTLLIFGGIMSSAPLVPIQPVVRFPVRKKKFKAMADKLKAQGRTYFASDNKDGLVVVLMDKVDTKSDRRIIYPEAAGGILAVQANECGPFQKIGRPAQVVTNERGERLRPVLNFEAKASKEPTKYHVKEGGHVAIFEAGTLVVIKAVNDTQKLSITKFYPMQDGDAAWIANDLIYMGDRNIPLPEQFAHFNEAVAAVNERISRPGTTQMHFGIGDQK
jgi:hypothetical protein